MKKKLKKWQIRQSLKLKKAVNKNVKLHAKWKDFDNSFASDTS